MSAWNSSANWQRIKQSASGTRVMAQFQMLETAYQLERYEQVVVQGEAFLADFPNSVYESSVYYNMGWSSFQLERYTEAIGYYEQVLFLSPRGLNSDRALLQIAECQQRPGELFGGNCQLRSPDQPLRFCPDVRATAD